MRLILSAIALFLSFGIHAQLPDSLRGDWKCVDIQCRMMCETCCVFPHYDIRIQDSIATFSYPYQYFGSSVIHPEEWQLSNDTLIRTPKPGTKFCYKRQEPAFNDIVVQALIRDTINVLLIANKKWGLITWQEDTIGEEDFDHTVRYPFKLPKFLFFRFDELKAKRKGTQLLLTIDGKKRWCTIVELTSSRLTFRTGKWYKEPVDFTYLTAE